MSVQILQSICHQAVLSERYNRVIRAENKVREKRSIQGLQTTQLGKEPLGFHQRVMIPFVLAQVIPEVSALMLNVEAGLADGIEPNHQFSQARRSCHQDDFVIG